MAGTKAMPAIVTLVAGLVLGVLAALNQVAFEPTAHWHFYITVAIVFGGVFGFKALAGGAFKAALNLPQWANTLIGAVLAAATLLLTGDIGLSHAVKAIIAGAVAVLGTLGFGPPGPALAATFAIARRR